MEPDVVALDVPQPREIAPRQQEGLLHGVLGRLVVAQDPVRDREASVTVGVDELAEGDVVAPPRSFHQRCPHLDASSAAPLGGRFAG